MLSGSIIGSGFLRGSSRFRNPFAGSFYPIHGLIFCGEKIVQLFFVSKKFLNIAGCSNLHFCSLIFVELHLSISDLILQRRKISLIFSQVGLIPCARNFLALLPICLFADEFFLMALLEIYKALLQG